MCLKCTRASFLPSSYSEDLLTTTLAFPKELMIWKVIIAIAVEVTVMKTLKTIVIIILIVIIITYD